MAIFYTHEGICRDCYKCVRYCPVKAIRVQQGQASVEEDRCIGDGLCMRTCPRGAIGVRSQVPEVEKLLAGGEAVVASVAPSFGGDWEWLRKTLTGLGFRAVESAEVAARELARRYRELAREGDGTVLASRCPGVVRLVETYYPAAIPSLAPLPTLAMAHARILRVQYGSTVKVVHFGSCTAARTEVGAEYGVDAVISFAEAQEWIADRGGERTGQLGPAERKTVSMVSASDPWVGFCGVDQSMNLLGALREGQRGPLLAELWSCPGGCPEGPLVDEEETQAEAAELAGLDLTRVFVARPPQERAVRQEEVEEVLRRIGIETRADELDCGACGYPTCQEKAAAVVRGMAELDMCVPYIRRTAAHASAVIENTPNAILIVDEEMKVQFANPGFRRIFRCEDERVEGRPVSELLHTDLFERAREAGGWLSEKRRAPLHEVTYRAGVFPIGGDENLLAAVIVDVSEEEKERIEFDKVKQATLERAQEVITRQMATAQEIAGLLGETTAETKVLLVKLMDLVRAEGVG